MTTRKPLLAVLVLLCILPFLIGNALAGGPPPWAGNPGGPSDVPRGGPPPFAGPPPHAGGNNGADDGEALDFCTSPGAGEGPGGQAGKSSIAHLNFSQIDPDTDEAPEDGAWARIMYRWTAPLFDYVLNAHEVAPVTEYELTYQPEPMPSAGVICLGTGISNPGGNLNLQDAFDIATHLPAVYDENEEEAQLVLVLAADVDCVAGEMINWAPEEYLFGDEGMFYVHSDLDDDEQDEDDEDNDNDNDNGDGEEDGDD